MRFLLAPLLAPLVVLPALGAGQAPPDKPDTPRRIAGAGLDVFEEEPRVHAGLLPLERVVLTPHLGSAVAELRETMAHIVVDNILAVLKGERPPNLYNAEEYA